MTQKQKEDPALSPEPRNENGLSRRNLLTLASATVAASVAAVAPSAAADKDLHGYFFVFEPQGMGGDPEADTRVFFVPSRWLRYFEVTDAYVQYGYNPADIVSAIRGSGSSKVKKMKAFYGDTADVTNPLGGTFMDLSEPTGNQTYVAMMATPGVIPA